MANVPKPLSVIEVIHTDEKHPSKKRKSNKKFVIASAGRCTQREKSSTLHANLASSNDKDAIQNHYNELIDKGLDTKKVQMVVTDLLPAYEEVIANTFPMQYSNVVFFILCKPLRNAKKIK